MVTHIIDIITLAAVVYLAWSVKCQLSRIADILQKPPKPPKSVPKQEPKGNPKKVVDKDLELTNRII